MKLSKPMIEVFTQVAHGKNTRESLSQSLHKSQNWITEIILDLEKEGFIKKQRDYKIKGSRLIIEIANTYHALKLKELSFEYLKMPLEDLMANSKILFLASVSEDWASTNVATQVSSISKYAIDKYRPQLKNRGVIMQKGDLYKINEKAWPLLKEFIIAYKNYSTIKGNVKWKYQNEILFEIDNEDLIQGSLTGFAKYKEYGVLVRVISALCKLPASKISKEEIFVHSLFEVDNPRTLHLALTFYLKNKLKYEKILPIAMKYGKYTMFENFAKLLSIKENKIKLEALPTFDREDFMRIAHMYGVKNV